MQRKQRKPENASAVKQGKMSVNEVFAMIDHDQDGEIPTSDLLSAVRAAGVPSTKEQISKYVVLHE